LSRRKRRNRDGGQSSTHSDYIVGAADLYQLYDDKTWLWADGAGFFAKSGDFSAWTGSGDKASYATGFWWVNDQGVICFDGNWRTKEGANSAITCFSHRTDGKVLYQRRAPSGAWYVFKSDPVKSGDEFERLKAGDQVEAQLETVRTEVGASAPQGERRAVRRASNGSPSCLPRGSSSRP